MQLSISARTLLLNSNNELLLVTHPGENFNYIVGGRLNPEESLIECAKREVYEEIGLRVDLEKLVYVQDYISDHRGEPTHFIAFYFIGRTDGDLPQNWHDTGGKAPITAKFYSRTEMEKLPIVYPEFIKTNFWQDLENNFTDYEMYIKT